MSKILVTGSQGFIGGYVVNELVGRGFSVIRFDRNFSGHDQRVQVEDYMGDIRDSSSVTEAMAHSDGWIHLAGVLGTQETIKNPRPAAETNILGGLNVLEAADQYKTPGVNIAVGNYWMNNTYSITKSSVERFCEMYRKERQTPVTVVRALNAYGPGQSVAAPYGNSKVRKIVPSFACHALTGKAIQIYGDGTQIMDMVWVGDVARDLVNAMIDTAAFGPKNYVLESGPGRDTTVNHIAEAVWNSVDQIEFGGTDYAQHSVHHLPMRPGEPEHSVVKAQSPYGISYLSLETGILQTVRWFKEVKGEKWKE